MQIDDVAAAGSLVKTVHVLRNEQLDAPFPFELRERKVRAIRLRSTKKSPADQAAGPIAFARVLIVHERLEQHGPRPLPLAVVVAIVGDAGVRAATGAGQHEQSTMPVDEIAE